jgi:hypothetical protein
MPSSNSDPKKNLLRNAIVTGVISSVIFTFLLQPFVLKIWPLLKNSGLQIYTNFNNKIYAAAAIGYRFDVERITSAFFTAAFISVTVASIVFFGVGSRSSESLRKLTNKIDFPRWERSKVVIWISRIIMIITVIAMVAFSIRQLLNTILIYGSTELNASFQQRLNAISPYLTESDEEALISSWALMKNETDYTKLNEQLELVAEANGIALPQTLWPDVLNNDYAWP